MPKPKLAATLRNAGVQLPSSNVPVWKGPSEFYDWNGGITFSMLDRFLCCRERFRLQYVLGLSTPESFRPALDYGNMWHACEEAFAAGASWQLALHNYAKELAKRYRPQQDQVQHWYRVCLTQFPIYVEYWKKHRDVTQRTPIAQECVFDVAYRLPSGRTVRLRGKLDAVDLIGPKGKQKIYLQENKSKSDIDVQKLTSNLRGDLQTCLYLVAAREAIRAGLEPFEGYNNRALAGVRYNVIRRPLSGGKHSIRQHQAKGKKPAETPDEFYKRLGGLIKEDADYFFARWNADMPAGELVKFERRILQPILEQVCDWYDWIEFDPLDPWKPRKYLGQSHEVLNRIHWIHPYGLYNVVNEGGVSDVEECLHTGSEVGLERRTRLFNELEV